MHVEEAFLHCVKALIRAKLCDRSRGQDHSALPSYGEMVSRQLGIDAEVLTRYYDASTGDDMEAEGRL